MRADQNRQNQIILRAGDKCGAAVWWLPGVLGVGCVFGQAPSAPGPDRSAGVITANNVYVRSGPSENHYPVTKLSAGQRVQIVGQTGGWYEIDPPAGVFSYISGDYVDTTDNRTGVVNGDNVRVRAGSNLPDFSSQRYVVQSKLDKGAEVTILGRDPDGFVRIKPPPGTRVWIHRDFVSTTIPSGDETTSAAGGAGDQVEPDASHDASDGLSSLEPKTGVEGRGGFPLRPAGAAAGSASVEEPTGVAVIPPSRERDELAELDSAMQAELAKPEADRKFTPLIERYRQVATRDDIGDIARRYAQVRIDQLQFTISLSEAAQRIRQLGREAEAARRAFLQERATIREALPPIPSGLDAQGELRASALYPPGSPTCRYRLVDRSGAAERTVAYIEIPDSMNIDVKSLLGRFVGVRAAAKRLQTGGVNPVPILVAAEMFAVQPPQAAEPPK